MSRKTPAMRKRTPVPSLVVARAKVKCGSETALPTKKARSARAAARTVRTMRPRHRKSANSPGTSTIPSNEMSGLAALPRMLRPSMERTARWRARTMRDVPKRRSVLLAVRRRAKSLCREVPVFVSSFDWRGLLSVYCASDMIEPHFRPPCYGSAVAALVQCIS